MGVFVSGDFVHETDNSVLELVLAFAEWDTFCGLLSDLAV
jgi:hypothetical protein